MNLAKVYLSLNSFRNFNFKGLSTPKFEKISEGLRGISGEFGGIRKHQKVFGRIRKILEEYEKILKISEKIKKTINIDIMHDFTYLK